MQNIRSILNLANNKLIEGDIRNYETCFKAATGIDVILHEAALGSIPRSINDPITTSTLVLRPTTPFLYCLSLPIKILKNKHTPILILLF